MQDLYIEVLLSAIENNFNNHIYKESNFKYRTILYLALVLRLKVSALKVRKGLQTIKEHNSSVKIDTLTQATTPSATSADTAGLG